ncbi:MAG TPA: hypothetical protein VKT77_18825, partial [Chthonomonadaceae bacterium]|nr:hypothetical protein [Chthonomonadaceae bacterium]
KSWQTRAVAIKGVPSPHNYVAALLVIAVTALVAAVLRGGEPSSIGGAILLGAVIVGLVRAYSKDLKAALFRGIPVERSMARLLSQRTDPRFLPALISLHEMSVDGMTREYVIQGLRSALPRVSLADREIVRPAQRFLAKLLLRPLLKVELTLGAIQALEAAGDQRGLDFVRSLSHVYERDIALWDEHQVIEEQESEEERRTRFRIRQLNLEIQGSRGGRTGAGGASVYHGEYVPRLGHLDAKQQRFAAPELTPPQVDQLRRVAAAGRACALAMEARLAREASAATLLHASSAPRTPDRELVRAAAGAAQEDGDLLRPEGEPHPPEGPPD